MTCTTFLSQILGFLLQTLPVALLAFVPFGQKSLRFSRKKLALFTTAGILVLSLIFALGHLLLFRPSDAYGQFLRTASNLYMGFSIFLFILFFWFSVRTAAAQKVLILTLLFHYSAILFTITSVVLGVLQKPPYHGPTVVYGTETTFLYLLQVIIIGPVVYAFLKRVVKISLPYMTSPVLRRGCFYMVTTFLLYSLCVFSLTNYHFYYGVSGYPVLFFLFAFILTNVIVYYMFFSEVHLEAKNRELQDQLRTFDEKYRQISSAVAESRRARHDIRHHLNVISVLHREGKEAELEQYLEGYEAFCQELEKLPLSGYSSLDSILRYYIQRAREDGISVQTDLHSLPGNLRFDVIDLTVLLGNLMENAIDACRKLPADKDRFLRIWVRQENVSLLLQIENACPDDGCGCTEFTDGKAFVSTKHSVLRGQGLKSIRIVADKYGGSAEFKKDAGIFTARIVLNIP